jgi:subtilase family serine protease
LADLDTPRLDPNAVWSPTYAIDLNSAKTYGVEAKVDAKGTIAESDEGNNSRSKAVVVSAAP